MALNGIVLSKILAAEMSYIDGSNGNPGTLDAVLRLVAALLLDSGDGIGFIGSPRNADGSDPHTPPLSDQDYQQALSAPAQLSASSIAYRKIGLFSTQAPQADPAILKDLPQVKLTNISQYANCRRDGQEGMLYLCEVPISVSAGIYPRLEQANYLGAAGNDDEVPPASVNSGYQIAAGAVLLTLSALVAVCAATKLQVCLWSSGTACKFSLNWLLNLPGAAILGMLLAFAGVFALFAGLGTLAKGAPEGGLIDERGRLSLSRFQLIAWNILIIGAFWYASFFNIGNNVIKFPDLSATLLALIGLAGFTAILSPQLLQTLRNMNFDDNVDPQAVSGGQAGTQPPDSLSPDSSANHGGLDIRKGPDSWRWSDLIQGEAISNRGAVDASRLQQLIFTVICLAIYAGLVMRDFIVPLSAGDALSLPNVPDSMLELLAISHGSYLIAKGTNTQLQQQQSQKAP